MDHQSQKVSRRVRGLEVGVFLFLILPAMIFSSLFVESRPAGFPVVAGSTIIQDLGWLSLVLFFIWRNGEPLQDIGWNRSRAGREILAGVVLFIPYFVTVGAIQALIEGLGFPIPKAPPSFLVPEGSLQLALGLVFVTVVAISEETIFRGYLILRFTDLTKSTPVAVVLSSFVFALGHGYQRSGGMIGVALLGLLFAVIYLWRKNLIAPVVLHFLQDFVGIFIYPLYGGSV